MAKQNTKFHLNRRQWLASVCVLAVWALILTTYTVAHRHDASQRAVVTTSNTSQLSAGSKETAGAQPTTPSESTSPSPAPITQSSATTSGGTTMSAGSAISTPASTIPSVNGGTLALSQLSGSLSPGATFTVRIYENSNNDAANAVQAKLVYNATALEYVSTATAGQFAIAAATNTNTSGVIQLARASFDNTLTGTQAVTDLTFRVRADASGSTSLSLDRNGSNLVRSSDAADILQSVGSLSLMIGN